GELDQALRSFQKAVDLKPDFAIAHYNIGKVFQEHGHLHTAVKSYRQAISMAPNYADAHANLGLRSTAF
ncbi:MAG: tetratricopeptide repeat protein, partial [Pseudomonadota bacterium]